MGPKAMLVALGGAALWPLVAPLLGTGVAVGVVTGAMGLLGAPGQGFISDFLQRVAMRRDAAADTADPKLRAMLERELLLRLDSQDLAAAALREELSDLLQTVGAVEVAVEAAVGDARDELARGLAELGADWTEFRWVVAKVQDMLHDIQTRQAEALALQREQLDLQREQLVKTNVLIGIHIPRAEPPPVDERLEHEPDPAEVACPYKGLESFQPEDAGYFFGREELVAHLLARLAESPFLAVIGGSGSGKSSLLRAGVVPALWAGALPHSKDWVLRIMTPGREPLEELAMRVSLLQGLASGSLLADLRADPRHLGLAVRQALLDAPEPVRVVLVIDQLEELFTLGRSDEERQLFLEALLGAVAQGDGRAVVVAAVRADFYGRLAGYAAFAAAVRDNQVLVSAMSDLELKRAIEQPASAAGLSTEPGLAEVMVQDLAGEPGALPLLSHALLETWKRRRGRTLTVAGYLESGGVREAIARTADRVFSERLSRAQRLIARQVFFRLTEPGDGTEDTRRRARFDELVPRSQGASAVEAVVNVLADERLLTTGEGTVELAHEALIQHWPTLRGWLDEDRAGRRLHRRLSEAAEEWERVGRDDTAVYRGVRLAEAVEWVKGHPESVNQRERAFLAAGVTVRNHEHRRTRASVAVLLALLVVGSSALIIALWQRASAARERRLADSRAIAATAESEVPVNARVGLLLAIEAARKARTDEATDALRQALLQPENRVTFPVRPDFAELSRDGRTLLTEAFPNAALWDARTGARRVQFAPIDDVSSAAVSPSGRLIATADSSDTVSVWTSTGRLVTRRIRHDNVGPGEHQVVGAQPFSPDEKLLVTTDGQHAATIWEAKNGRAHAVLRATSTIYDAGFSPDGRYVAATTGDNHSEVWQVATGAPVAVLVGGTPRFSPDSRRILTFARPGVDVWALPSGRQIVDLPGLSDSATFSQNGRYLLLLSAAGVRILAVDGWKQVAFPPPQIDLPTDVPGFAPDGRFAMDRDRLVSVPTGETVARFHPGSMTPVFSADGTSFVASDDAGLHIWTIPVWRAIPLTPGTDVLGLQATGDHWIVAISDRFGAARVWEAKLEPPNREARPQVEAQIPAVNVAFARDGGYMAAVTARGDVDIWRIATWKQIARLPKMFRGIQPGDRPPLAISDDGREIGVWPCGVLANTLNPSIWDVATGRRLSSRAASNCGSSDTVVISPDGRLVATRSSDGVAVWNARTGQVVTTLRVQGSHAQENQVEPTAFNRSGTRVLTVSYGGDPGEVLGDETAQIWDTHTGDVLAAMVGHSSAVIDAAFSPDDAFVTTASIDGTVRVWESGSGRAVASLPIRASVVGVGRGPVIVAAGAGIIHTIACDVCHPFADLLKLAQRRAHGELTRQERREFLP
jgi:WD40 repeat protein